MAPSSKNTAIVLICRRSGELINVVHNELGLPEGTRFESYVAAFDRRRAKRFLDAISDRKTVLDCKLNVLAAGGTMPLFFSAASSGAELVIVATRGRFESGTDLPAKTGHARTMRTA